MLISQIKGSNGEIIVAAREPGAAAKAVKGATSVYALAMEAADGGKSLVSVIEAHGYGDAVDLEKAYAEGRFLPPITHPDAAHLHLTGTGLTHLGSAATRDSMHKKTTEAAEETLTDSMKMFRMGLEGGKPAAGQKGVQPEWFYKGNGYGAAAPGAPLVSPSFALDGGEEPEMAGIYVIAKDGTPFRIGFALSNEPGTGLFLLAVFRQLARDRQPSGKIGMSAQHTEALFPARRAENGDELRMHTIYRQLLTDKAIVIGPLGDEGRMLEDATEARHKFVARNHQIVSGLWFACQCCAISIRRGIHTLSCFSTYSMNRLSDATRPGRPTRRQCSPTDIIFGLPSLPSS